jgi:serine/threonine protein kinase
VSEQVVGSYVLVEKLGEGGMGEVYLADHKYIARRAAIKFLLRDLSGSSELVGRFFAEARAASVIKHPGIVEVLDCDVHDDGRAYIVMELLRGESLRDYIERVSDVGRDEPGALAIFLQISSALAAAHAQEIIHRDLKPDNIFLHLAEGGEPSRPIVKVLDFGIAKLMGRVGEGGTKTRTGQLLGTPMYMSPEQCRGAGQVDSRSDIYSLGCIMYELLCGRPPFLDEGFGDLIIAHVSQPPPEPLRAAPWMSRATRQILLACLAKDARERPQSMDQLVGMLTQAGAAGLVQLQTPVSMSAHPARRGPSSDSRTPAQQRHAPRLAQTTPMPGQSAAATPMQRPPRTPPAIVTPAGAGRTRLLPSETNTLQEGASESFQPTIRTRGGGTKVAIAVGAIAAVALAAFVIIRTLTAPTGASANGAPAESDENQHPATSSKTQASAADQQSAAVAAAPRAQPAQPSLSTTPATSVIKLAQLPAAAIVHLDGQIVTPPLTVPRKADTHRLLVEADGYLPLELSFDGDADRTVDVVMKRTGAPITGPPVARSRKRSERSRHESPSFKAFTDL